MNTVIINTKDWEEKDTNFEFDCILIRDNKTCRENVVVSILEANKTLQSKYLSFLNIRKKLQSDYGFQKHKDLILSLKLRKEYSWADFFPENSEEIYELSKFLNFDFIITYEMLCAFRKKYKNLYCYIEKAENNKSRILKITHYTDVTFLDKINSIKTFDELNESDLDSIVAVYADYLRHMMDVVFNRIKDKIETDLYCFLWMRKDFCFTLSKMFFVQTKKIDDVTFSLKYSTLYEDRKNFEYQIKLFDKPILTCGFWGQRTVYLGAKKNIGYVSTLERVLEEVDRFLDNKDDYKFRIILNQITCLINSITATEAFHIVNTRIKLHQLNPLLNELENNLEKTLDDKLLQDITSIKRQIQKLEDELVNYNMLITKVFNRIDLNKDIINTYLFNDGLSGVVETKVGQYNFHELKSQIDQYYLDLKRGYNDRTGFARSIGTDLKTLEYWIDEYFKQV